MREIRTLGQPDLSDALIIEVAELLGDRVRSGAALGWVEPPSSREIATLLEQLCAADQAVACPVAVLEDGQLAGFGYWRRYDRPTHRMHADLEKMAVAEQFAGRGIGRALLRELIDRATAARVHQLTLDFRGDNAAAETLYRSAGFQEYGRLNDFVSPGDGTVHDKVMFVLRLPAD